MTEPLFLIVDLFCGAGGVTTGFVKAKLNENNIAKVIACVNHDAKAIESHWKNHPEVKHFEEDIRTLDLTELKKLVEYNRIKHPNAFVVLWASLECTNFSKAKGGQPRDADSRTLADHLDRYVKALDPDYIKIENVVEFMSWGPLDENGKPVSRKSGADWMRWRKEMCDHGYYDEWKELNSADFGAYTSRNRLFGCFARHGLPIVWPEATHSKKVSKGLFDSLKPWKPVKEVLDFEDEGTSIFNRKKDLSDKTLERIYAGLIKYVANGDSSFISKYFSGRPAGKVNSIDVPSSTVTTFGNQSLVQTKSLSDPEESKEFLLKYNSTSKKGVHVPPSIHDPCPTLCAQDRIGLVQTQFLSTYHGKGANIHSIDSPSPVIPTKDSIALYQCEHFLINYNHSSKVNGLNDPSPTLLTKDKLSLATVFIDKHFRKYAQNQSINQPAGTILPTDKHRLVEAVPFVMPTNYNNKPVSIEQPCPVIIARQDKAPLYLVQATSGCFNIPIYDTDSPIMVKIKQFMAAHNLVDIKMRMLRVHELLKIQGFPEDYELAGNQADQKKFIGNSVVPQVVKVWCEAMGGRLLNHQKKIA